MKTTMTFTQKEVEKIVADEALRRLKGARKVNTRSWVTPGYEGRMSSSPSTYRVEVEVEDCGDDH